MKKTNRIRLVGSRIVAALIVFCFVESGFAAAHVLCDQIGRCAAVEDIRWIGNGGGLGEMKAAYAFQNIRQFYGFCLWSTNPCQLTMMQMQTVQQLDNQLSAILLEGIDFDYTGSHAIPFRWVVKHGLVLDSAALYVKPGQSKTSGEIAALVWAGLLSRFQPGQELALLSWCQSKLAAMQETVVSAPVNSSSMGHLGDIRAIVLFDGRSQSSLEMLAFEMKDMSIDLTARVKERLACDGDAHWRVYPFAVSSRTTTEFVLQSQIIWSCASGVAVGGMTVQNWTGNMYITLPFDLRGVFLFNLAQVNIFGAVPSGIFSPWVRH